MRQTITPPLGAVGMSRASWCRDGNPAPRPQRQATARVARSIDVSVPTIDQAAHAYRDECAARLRQYQDWILRKLLKKYPRKSGEQIARMINAHIADLSGEQLAKIMGQVPVGRAGKDAPKPARG